MESDALEEENLSYLKNLKILCVEDDKTTRLLYDSFLEDVVKEITFAQDGEEGYQSFLNFEIDIIIADYHMPNLNGLEMIEKIRHLNKSVPIIFASSVEDYDVLIDTLISGVDNFLKKPIKKDELFKALFQSVELLKTKDRFQKQKEKENYTSYQEKLGFKKELNILRNDFYYQMLEGKYSYLVDFLYKPLDTLSGDAYCARRIDEHNTFYLMIDGMGKGISASLTAMIMTSFVNHVIDKMIQTDHFDLSILVHETMEYIKPILLDEEAVAIDYILLDYEEDYLYYAKFAMPVLLMENKNKELVRLKSNNPPLSKWQNTFNIGSYDISEIEKFLIYSDGIAENETMYDGKAYADFIEEDFLNAFSREDLKNSFFEKIETQEDDISLIFIYKFSMHEGEVLQESFETSFVELDRASEWYEKHMMECCRDETVVAKSSVVFTELLMNAFEHGNLGINYAYKHQLLEEDKYFETLDERSQTCDKKIQVTLKTIEHNETKYVVTKIKDDGEGFDTQLLSEIFRNADTFNGRGVFVSRKNSSGIYYNAKGDSVLFIMKAKQN